MPEAVADLEAIRNWTRDKFWGEQARQYVAWLRLQARKVARNPELGRPIVSKPGIYVYLCLWKASSRNGHNLFYRVKPDSIEVIEFRHTSRDDT